MKTTNILRILIPVISYLGFLLAEERAFSGYNLYRLRLTNDKQVSGVQQLADKLGLDIWEGPQVGGTTDVLVPPQNQDEFENFLNSNTISFDVEVQNLADYIAEEAKSNERAKMMKRFRSAGNRGDIVGIYSRFDDINQWLVSLTHKYSFCTLESIGRSYEGRDMKVLKMATGPNKPVIFIDAGIHAREWLAPATIIFVMDQLLTRYAEGDSEAKEVLDKYELQFLPVVNPDGYEYSHMRQWFRLWRKTRKPYGSCYGADPNRNFDSKFGGPSTSSNPCSDLHHGPYAFSEPETANLRDHILKEKHRMLMYFSTHSYSQLWFIPYGFTKTPPPDNDEMVRVATIGNNALFRTHGIRFELGSPANLLYAAAGGSYDWVKQKVGVKYSYTFELRPGRNRGGAGFIAPVSLIRPSGEEIYNGIVASILAARA